MKQLLSLCLNRLEIQTIRANREDVPINDGLIVISVSLQKS